MAFYTGEDEEEQGLEGPQATGAQSASIGGGAAGAPAAAGGAAEPKAEPFVGISQYINANKPQSEKLANQVAGKIDEKATAFDTSLNNAQNSFNQAAQSQQVQANDDLVNEVKTNAAGVAGDEGKKNSFTQLRDAKYSGPQGLEDLEGGSTWAQLQADLKKAQDAKAAAGTEEGRMGLIKEVSNNPRQSQGALEFDNLLLQSNPNSASKLQAAGAGIADAGAKTDAAKTSAAAKAKEISDANKAISDAAKGALTSGYGDLKTALTGKEADLDAQQKKFVEDLKKAFASGQVGQGELEQLGLTGDMRTFGQNAGDYLDYVDGADINSVATDEDLARQQALLALAGDMDLGGPLLSSSSPLGQVGQGYNFKTNDFTNAIGQQQAQYQAAIAPLQNTYDQQMAIFNSIGTGSGTSAADVQRALRARDAANAAKAEMDALAAQYKANQTINNPMTAGLRGGLAGPQRIGA